MSDQNQSYSKKQYVNENVKKCLQAYNKRIEQTTKDYNEMCQEIYTPKHQLRGDIFMCTWNVNEHALDEHCANTIRELQNVSTKIIVLAFQEVEKVRNAFMGRHNNAQADIKKIVESFCPKYQIVKNIEGSNQILVILADPGRVNIQDFDARVTVLNSGFGQKSVTKGALCADITYHDQEKNQYVEICFLAAHLNAHEDTRSLTDKKCFFEQRVMDFSHILYECNAWYSKNHSTVEKFLDFDIIFGGDLNWRMLYDKPERHMHFDKKKFDVEAFVMKNEFGFDENEINFRPTYKVHKENPSLYNYRPDKTPNHHMPSWTDRLLFHSPSKKIKQIDYDILLEYPDIEVSDHLPVCAVYNIMK